jgi:hypothetical protein
MITTNQARQALQNLFGQTAQEVARAIKHEQRQSKLSGLKFMQVMVLDFLQHPTASLNILYQVAADFGGGGVYADHV